MDSVFGLHHLAHAHNAEITGDSLAGLDARGMKTVSDGTATTPGTDERRNRRFRAEVRDWLAAHVPAGPLPSVDTAEGFAGHRAWERELAAARLSVVSWPPAYGGRDASLLDWLVFEEEYYAAAAPVRVGQNGLFLLAPTLLRTAPPSSGTGCCRRWPGPTRSGRRPGRSRTPAATWPRSGPPRTPDRRGLAAVGDQDVELARGVRGPGVRAVPVRSRQARRPDLPAVRPAADGVTVRPIRQLGGGTGFAEIFLDGVFVPDADVVGAPGDGWRIAMSTAGHERGLSLRSPGRFTAAAARLVELWQRAGGPADSLRDRVADAWIGAQAYRLHTFATAARLAAGGTLGAEASLGKVFWSELDVALHETALDLLGPRAELRDGADGRWLDGYLFALAGPIYAGTNEIQRTVIAERLLGLPR